MLSTGDIPGAKPSEPSAGADQIALDEPSALAHAVRAIAIEKNVHSFDKRRFIADRVERELKLLGEFYCTRDGHVYFLPNSARRLLELGSSEFTLLLMEVSGLRRTETFFRFVFDQLEVLAWRSARCEVHTLSHYDEKTGMLAVSNGGSGTWIREPGSRWQRTLNGENGLVFRTDPDADPWEPAFPSSADSGELEQLDWFMKQFPFVVYEVGAYHSKDISPNVQRNLLRMCLFQRFFSSLACTNLIPTFLGPPGQGSRPRNDCLVVCWWGLVSNCPI